MKVYTYSEARRWFSRVLDEAREGGEIIASVGSPLDVPGVDADLSRDDIMGAIREGRERDRDLGSA